MQDITEQLSKLQLAQQIEADSANSSGENQRPRLPKDIYQLTQQYLEGDLPLYRSWATRLFDNVISEHYPDPQILNREYVINRLSEITYNYFGPNLANFFHERHLQFDYLHGSSILDKIVTLMKLERSPYLKYKLSQEFTLFFNELKPLISKMILSTNTELLVNFFTSHPSNEQIVNERYPYFGYYPLHDVIINGWRICERYTSHIPVNDVELLNQQIKLLLDYGADPNLVDTGNHTPLDLIMSNEGRLLNIVDEEILLRLIEMTDVRSKSSGNGHNPIVFFGGAYQGHQSDVDRLYRIFSKLVSKGADVNVRIWQAAQRQSVLDENPYGYFSRISRLNYDLDYRPLLDLFK